MPDLNFYHPLEILRGYRLGSRQATVELQRDDAPGIHIEFALFQLVDHVRQQPGQAVILTGTAGDGKTYLAYRVIEALGLDKTAVRRAQPAGGYDQDGIFIDLDLSAGSLSKERLTTLITRLNQPQRLTLICANEGKLDELEEKLKESGQAIAPGVLRLNLSHRALVSPAGWQKVLHGALEGELWADYSETDTILARNRAWMQDPALAERLRRYLLLPYLLGEPITVRETLSFLAYALGSGLDAVTHREIASRPATERLPYLLFNTLFSTPDGYEHGDRAVPNEKLLWWLFRFDPAIQASPEVDLRLLVELDQLDATPPAELLTLWREELLVREGEKGDSAYRRRLHRYMQYARRWYTLASERGFDAYFPFRHFRSYLDALNDPADHLIAPLIKGLNRLLSAGQVEEEYELKRFHLPTGDRPQVSIYSASAIDESDFSLLSDLDDAIGRDAAAADYLERLPRRLYLQPKQQPEIRLPISLLLYEVLMSAASDAAGFPATLWVKERDTVARFMSALSRLEPIGQVAEFHIVAANDNSFTVKYRPARKAVTISGG
jgi:hypothetical protein